MNNSLSLTPTKALESGLDVLLAALRQHYGELIGHVRLHAARLGGDQNQASDIVHEVCIELMTKPPRLAVHTPLAFLREISRRRAIDHYRREQVRSKWVENTDQLPEIADPGSFGQNPAHLIANRQTLLLLINAIDALPPRCRDVFVLCKIHEYTNAAAAEHLAISIKTVEKHLRTGLLQCRTALMEEQ